MILIGSRSLFIRNPKLLTRAPIDFDFVSTREECQEWIEKNKHKIGATKEPYEIDGNKVILEGKTNVEFEIIQAGTSSELLDELVYNDPKSIETAFGMVPTTNLLFTIKDSHKYKKFHSASNHFWKTARDWHILKAYGCEIEERYKEFHNLRSQETYSYLHPNLNVSKENFFKDDAVHYEFEHDDIHQAVAIGNRPAYTYYLKDGSEVLSSRKKFFECSEEVRLNGVIEEASVLALERSIIPFPNYWTTDFAFQFALSKVASSITSGFFRQYCFENIFTALKLYKEKHSDYYKRFQKVLNEGQVRRTQT